MSDDALHERDGGLLLFKAGGRALALPLADIVEIIRPTAMTRVPNCPPELLGIANFRGSAVPTVSVSALLGGRADTTAAAARVIMVKRKAIVGLMVDEVSALAETSEANLIDIDGLLAKNFRFQARKDRKFETSLESAKAEESARHEFAVLAFVLGHQEFALAIDKIEGVALVPASIAHVPRTDQAMIGAAEIDGALVPLVSLRFLLGMAPGDLDEKTSRIVLVRLGDARVGIAVDSVKEILRIAEDTLDPVPAVLTRGKGEAQIEAICRLDDGRRLISILAVTKLFDANTVARILAEAEHGSAHMPGDDDELIDGEQFIVFQLGDESYGLPIGSVDEVVRCPDTLTRVPTAPAFVGGLMNLRGRAVPVIDQRQRFSAGCHTEELRRRIVVVTVDGLKTGFLVDRVSEVLTVPASEVSPAPELASDAASVIDRVAMIKRDGHMILLVDPKALLNRAERDVLECIANTAGAPNSQ